MLSRSEKIAYVSKMYGLIKASEIANNVGWETSKVYSVCHGKGLVKKEFDLLKLRDHIRDTFPDMSLKEISKSLQIAIRTTYRLMAPNPNVDGYTCYHVCGVLGLDYNDFLKQ